MSPRLLVVDDDDRIRELGNNQIDHTPFSRESLPNQYVDYWASARPFAPSMIGGDTIESWMHFRTRVGSFIESLLAKHREVAAFVRDGIASCH